MKFMSRKIILSWVILLFSVWFLLSGDITETNFGILLSSIVAVYTMGKTIEKKLSIPARSGENSWKEFVSRIKALFSREFLMSILAIIGLSLLVIYDYVSGDLWFKTILVIGNSYNLFNSIEKIDV